MKKLVMVIRYECTTSFKYIWIFYACVALAVSVISAIVYISTGSFDKIGTNGLEVNSMIYLGILGVLGFQEDFKMLIQNGFTRKYIFLSTLSLFVFVSAVMAAVDTIIGNALHMISKGYHSLFGGLYGYGHSYFINWLWLFLVDMAICCLFYLAILAINKIGKTASIIAGIAIGLSLALVVPAVFKLVLPKDFSQGVIKLLVRGSGFMTDGSVNLCYPILLLFLFIGILSFCSYHVIHRTELKA